MLTPDEIQAMKEQDAGDRSESEQRQFETHQETIARLSKQRHKLLLDREELQAEIERLKPSPPIDPRKPITVKDKYEPLQFHTLKEKDFIDGKLTDLKDFGWLVKELIKERNSMAETSWNSNSGYIKAQQEIERLRSVAVPSLKFMDDAVTTAKELDSLRRDKERLDWLSKQSGHAEPEGINDELIYTLTFRYPEITDDGSETLCQAIDAAIAQEQKGEK